MTNQNMSTEFLYDLLIPGSASRRLITMLQMICCDLMNCCLPMFTTFLCYLLCSIFI